MSWTNWSWKLASYSCLYIHTTCEIFSLLHMILVCLMVSTILHRCHSTWYSIDSHAIHLLTVFMLSSRPTHTNNIQHIVSKYNNFPTRKYIWHDDVIKWKHFPRYWPFVREPTGHRWIPMTKASDVELWYFLWSAREQTFEQTIDTPVIWDAIPLIMTSL